MATQLIRTDANASPSTTLSFEEATRVCRSIRPLLYQAVPDSVVREVLEDAQHAPSDCNTQPWTRISFMARS